MRILRKIRWGSVALEKLRRLARSGRSAKEIAETLRTTQEEVLEKARLEGFAIGRRPTTVIWID